MADLWEFGDAEDLKPLEDSSGKYFGQQLKQPISSLAIATTH